MFFAAESERNSFAFNLFWVVLVTSIGIFVYQLGLAWVWEISFLREDSRFFMVPPPSLGDIVTWFLTPQNSMAQYRPTTKVLWAVPQAFGFRSPNDFRVISFGLLAANGFLLATILYRSTGRFLLAYTMAWAYVLHPLHTKPLYWISAWHNSSVVTFGLLAFLLRGIWLKQIEEGNRSGAWLRLAFHIAWILAIGSRESGLLLALPFLALDLNRRNWWIRNWDVFLVSVFFFCFLYVFHQPLEKLQPQDEALFHPLAMMASFWDYVRALVFSAHEFGRDAVFGGFWISLGACGILLCLLASLLRPSSLPFVSLAAAGLGLHLLYRLNWQVEYLALFGSGVFLCIGFWLSKLRTPLAVFFASLIFLQSSVTTFYGKQLFSSGILNEGEAVREYFFAIDRLDRKLPPFQPVRFVETEALSGHPLERTFHLLPQSLQYFYPHRRWRWEVAATPGKVGLDQWILQKEKRHPMEALVRFRSFEFEAIE